MGPRYLFHQSLKKRVEIIQYFLFVMIRFLLERGYCSNGQYTIHKKIFDLKGVKLGDETSLLNFIHFSLISNIIQLKIKSYRDLDLV